MSLRTGYLAFAFAFLATSACSEIELGFYSGYQTAPHSEVNGTHPDGSPVDETFGWDGKSTESPPYYGLRATWWQQGNYGFGLEFTHAKTYANSSDRQAAGFERFEFTDGLNILTLNALRRWPGVISERLTPYVGGGIGIAFPHVDVETTAGDKTFEYQLTGPAARLMAGASFAITEDWSIFGEYQGTYSSHDVDLEPSGDIETEIITNALNLGVSFSF